MPEVTVLWVLDSLFERVVADDEGTEPRTPARDVEHGPDWDDVTLLLVFG